MKTLKLLAACTALALPSSAWALGASVSVGAGAVSAANTDFRMAAEVSPFWQYSLLRLELPLEFQLKPASSFALRPGFKVFLPLAGIYARAGLGWGNLLDDKPNSRSYILGAGWQLSLLNTVGIFLEATVEPSIPSGVTTYMARAGALVNL